MYIYCITCFFAVSQGNVTVYDSEESLLNRNEVTDALLCVWNGGLILKNEWLFLGDNVITPLAMTNRSWHMELLLCMVQSDCELQQCGEVFTIQGISITIQVNVYQLMYSAFERVF